MATIPDPTLILTGKEVAALLDMDACIAAVEEALGLYARGRCLKPGVLGVHAERGGFHVKAAGLALKRPYFAAKTNANFPGNPDRSGLPTIMGTLVLHDADDGRPLAIMDSMVLTALRTAAATAVAAKHLAPLEARTATLVGCGVQGPAQIRALSRVRPIAELSVVDRDAARARRLADALGAELGIAAAAAELGDAVRRSEMIVTCTTATQAFLDVGDVPAGAFVAAVGADNPEKQEIAPGLLAASAVITDSTEQCAAIGDLHHAIAAGVVDAGHVRAELGEVVAGLKPGRLRDDEIVVFDSTGIAVEDVAAAATVYEKAVQRGIGLRVAFGG